ncbi:tRNA (guanosine(37)-N1)-methyltransferase TrmD [Paenibacillus antri]|uniref:tRNA (guanine-N(1)-)-methyltransferase n=1 Tax=Paenibacillus antri TaxID=2582848 RepID=A0A5R9G231_9BACL|nr:tRNA (guanosine(37)-N1)-methyltransferase TrmD [Paenibacillus antri]TLS49871.1 tRNA (guanosine(37)-N1)-methyltransferase TrmD [Paenibacillus antri]
MRFDVLTLFPEMFSGMFTTSILGKAQEKGIVSLNAINFREFSGNKHHTVDDYPYGGGGGMVLKAEPIFNAVEHVVAAARAEAGEREPRAPRVVLMCPQGETYTQRKAEEFAKEDHIILVCGHYEGYDERIREHLVTDEISIGDYVLTGGEIAACAIVDSVTRLLPGALGNELSSVTDSYSTGLLEHPHYTRPAEFRGWKVPDVLISGHHVNVDAWRREQSLYRTWRRRPDLLERAELNDKERKLIERWKEEEKEKETK